VLSLVFQEMLLPGFGLEEWAQFHPERPETHLWHVAFYYVRDVPELLITGREREYVMYFLVGCIFLFFPCGRRVLGVAWLVLTVRTGFIKNEAYDPTNIDDDAIEDSSMSLKHLSRADWGAFSVFVCWRTTLPPETSYFHQEILQLTSLTDRATEKNVKDNKEAAKTKLKLPVLAVGSMDFIGKEVKKQMENVAENAPYQELNFGHQLAEECPEQLAKLYLEFLPKSA
jgi:hypothetical protein